MKKEVLEIAERIRELRTIFGLTTKDMAQKTHISEEEYIKVESGVSDFPFSFLHRCAKIFNVSVTDILTGDAAKLSTFSIVRKGEGLLLDKRDEFTYNHLAYKFKGNLSEPLYVTVPYNKQALENDIHLSTHGGEEFDYVLSGVLKVNIGGHIDYIHPGDSLYYKSTTPHGMVAASEEGCVFLAIVMEDSAADQEANVSTEHEVSHIKQIHRAEYFKPIYENYIDATEDSEGHLTDISFKNSENFNFAFDIVDELAKKCPDKVAMVHVDNNKNCRKFTFSDISRYSSMTANYFASLGIKKGDRVMLILKRHYQFWFSILALHKLGAIVIPATNQLAKKDLVYRFNAAGVSAIVCTADGEIADEVDLSVPESPTLNTKIIVNGERDGWHNFNSELERYSDKFDRPTGDEATVSTDPLLMFFTSGTTGYPKIATHAHTYPLGHFITAKYWHNVDPNGLHLTISDTGWAKSLWGKIYGQWLCEAAIFVYDFDRFNAHDILPMFKEYNITTFCAPPTMYRFFIKEDLSKYDLSSLKYATIAGEALNPEVYQQFYKATGIKLMEGFGQSESTLIIANLVGMTPKPGSMGKPSPLYDVLVVDPDGNPVKAGHTGEIVIKTDNGAPFGLFTGYYLNKEKTDEAWHDGLYHTGDTAWVDEDGYFWYVGRIDDLIKSSGYRIGPFEIESVLMELPYVLECAVTAAPDEIRGQVVKATIVLTKGTVPSDQLKKEIQEYVKKTTAPYKYPRIVEFVEELPKTISGKIKRSDIRNEDHK